jgi:hypothetical protein
MSKRKKDKVMQKLTIEQLGQVIGGLDTEEVGLDEAGLDEEASANMVGEAGAADEIGLDEASTGEK